MPSLEQRAVVVKLVCFDHDGVLTDNHVYTNQHGEEMCRYSRADGIGIERLRALGVHLAVISTEPNPVVAARCEKLQLPCYQGVADKRKQVEDLAAFHGVMLDECAFLGNDVNDLEAMDAVGLPAVVANPEVRLLDSLNECGTVYYWAGRKGGEGAVREFCDWIADCKERAAVAAASPAQMGRLATAIHDGHADGFV